MRHGLKFPICSSSQGSVTLETSFFPRKHDVFILNYGSHRLSAQVRCECRQNLQRAERLLRYTSYIILSCATLLEKHYIYEDGPDRSEDERMAGDELTAATGLPFGTAGCTEGEKQIWT